MSVNSVWQAWPDKALGTFQKRLKKLKNLKKLSLPIGSALLGLAWVCALCAVAVPMVYASQTEATPTEKATSLTDLTPTAPHP